MSKGRLLVVSCLTLLALAAATQSAFAANGPGSRMAGGAAAAATLASDAGPVRSGPGQQPAQTFTCPTNDLVVCFLGNRFQVTAQFTVTNGQPGGAHMVKLTDDSGYMWFFSADNVEVVMKVLDACPLNSEYWFFAGGLTNVDVVITVTDSATLKSKQYHNPQGMAFQPIQDASALAVCP
jgi:hypothetical protein